MAIGAAGVDADGQTVFLGRRVDRPVMALAEGHVAHHQHEDLDEAAIGGDAVDLVDRHFGVLRGDDDTGAQPRFLIQPFGGHPVIQRTGETRTQILAEQQLHAVQAIGDGDAGAKRIQRVLA